MLGLMSPACARTSAYRQKGETESNNLMTLRTWTTEKSYQRFKNQNCNQSCYLCRARPLWEFDRWKVVKNEFPYDQIAETNDILTTKKHTGEQKITRAEQKELENIKKQYISLHYDMILENTKKKKTIPEHFHLHLITMKQSAAKRLALPQFNFKFLSKALARAKAFVEA